MSYARERVYGAVISHHYYINPLAEYPDLVDK